MSRKIEPFSDWLVVRPIQLDAAGLVLPEGVDTDLPEAMIEAVGPGVWAGPKFIETECKVGETIVYFPLKGAEVTIDGNKHLFVRERDIFCRLTVEVS